MERVNHTERKHSTVGASGFSRWSVCPGSVRLSEGLESRDSEYSVEGTRAHEILEQCMRSGDDAWVHACAEGVTDEMVDGVQMFLDTVRGDLEEYERYANEHGTCLAPVILIEHRFSLEALGHPEAFGTADVAILFPVWGLLRVYDFKYGAGIVVEVENNGQLRYYGVGVVCDQAWAGTTVQHPISAVETVIVQPRCEHPDGYVRRDPKPEPGRAPGMSIDELNRWVEKDLLPAIKRTTGWTGNKCSRCKGTGETPLNGAEVEPSICAGCGGTGDEYAEPPVVDGPHCRFCPVKQAAACPLLDQRHGELAVAAEGAKSPKQAAQQLDDMALAERLAKIGPVQMYIKALQDEAFIRMQRGSTIPGWKLVPKKANRVLKDGAELAAKEQWGDGAYTEPALKSVAQLEKLKGGKEWCAEWADKPDNGVTLAPDTDKRDGVQIRSAKEVFSGLIGKTA